MLRHIANIVAAAIAFQNGKHLMHRTTSLWQLKYPVKMNQKTIKTLLFLHVTTHKKKFFLSMILPRNNLPSIKKNLKSYFNKLRIVKGKSLESQKLK